jgi:hypothetical protein
MARMTDAGTTTRCVAAAVDLPRVSDDTLVALASKISWYRDSRTDVRKYLPV